MVGAWRVVGAIPFLCVGTEEEVAETEAADSQESQLSVEMVLYPPSDSWVSGDAPSEVPMGGVKLAT